MTDDLPQSPSANEAASRRGFGVTRRWLEALRAHRWFAASAALCVFVFAWVVTGGTGRLIARESFGDFYDYQAMSLLRGRLDVPYEAIVFESFVSAGKNYGYFGPTPALLRIPSVLAGVGFGELSRLLLVAYYAASLLAGYLLLLQAVQLVSGGRTRPGVLTVGLFGLGTGLGSTLLFLGSRAYIYHEAILCGVMFALWGTWCALRHLAAPTGGWWLGSLLCGLLSVHARPPAGFFALATLGIVGLTLAWRERRLARAAGLPLPWSKLRHPTALAAAAAAAIFSFNVLSYEKFGTLEGCPLRLNIQYDQARLARIDGRQFHLANLLPNAISYFGRIGLTSRPSFPYLIATSPDAYAPGAKLDLTEPTVGIPASMPILTLFATLGAVITFATVRNSRPFLLAIWAAALPAMAAMFCAIAVTERYTADFLPWLIASSGFGFALFDGWLSRWRTAVGTVLLVLLGVNVALMLSLTLHHQGEVVWGVSAELRRNYAALREKFDRLIGFAVPDGYAVDRLPIRTLDANLAMQLPLYFAQAPATRARGIELGEEAMRNHPDLPQICFALGEIYAGTENGLSKAITCFERGLKLKPEFALGHQALGDLLVADNRIAEGIERYIVALQLNPNSAAAYNNLGVAYARLRRFNEALPAFEQAARLDPSYRRNLEKVKADLQARP